MTLEILLALGAGMLKYSHEHYQDNIFEVPCTPLGQPQCAEDTAPGQGKRRRHTAGSSMEPQLRDRNSKS